MRPEPIRVFVIDDSAEFIAAAREWIEAYPALAFAGSALDGNSALQAVERLRPDVVLIDIFMPGLDGLQTTRCLKASGNAPRIVLTSFDDSEAVRSAARMAGCDSFIPKSDIATRLSDALLGGVEQQGGRR